MYLERLLSNLMDLVVDIPKDTGHERVLEVADDVFNAMTRQSSFCSRDELQNGDPHLSMSAEFSGITEQKEQATMLHYYHIAIEHLLSLPTGTMQSEGRTIFRKFYESLNP